VNVTVIVVALLVAGALSFVPQVRSSRAWKATVTPLASIMGSGFLVSAPLVAAEVGVWAPVAMGGLLIVSFGIGSAIRFNIHHAEVALEKEAGDDDDEDEDGEETDGDGQISDDDDGGSERDDSSRPSATERTAGENRHHRGHHERSHGHWRPEERHLASLVERASHLVLAGAYIISATYYLQLLSAFVLDRLGMSNHTASRALTTTLLAIITVVGWRWGLSALEKLETYAVNLNLGMIAALLCALVIHDASLASSGNLHWPSLPVDDDRLHAVRVMMGLLIVVQGFETSRFLGSEHPAEERVKTMRWAQLIAGAIYLCFVTLMLPLLDGASLGQDVTAIVGLVAPVAGVLPTLVVVTAVGSQFSASVADDAGCAGLVATFTSADFARKWGYLLIGACTITLTWVTDVFAVISLASRAFALFYALQCAVSALTAHGRKDAPGRKWHIALGAVLAVVSLSVTVLGVPAE